MARSSTVARIPKLAAGRYLVFEDGDSLQVVQLTDGIVTVGRRIGAGVFLDDVTVSRRHALIVRRDAGTVILDDRSLNGVIVNGRRVDEAVLSDGDVILLGRARATYLERRA
jgi:pSer/pThr/pTyr-binding forkhead associated (FHA) protein